MSKATNFQSKYGPCALVTGASSGIGAELAEQIANKGVNIILVARRQERLQHLASKIEKKHGVRVISITRKSWTKNGAGVQTQRVR